MFVVKLNWIFEFSIFVNADRTVRTLTCYVLKKWIYSDALHIFLMALKCLDFSEFVRLYTPDDACAI